MPQIEIAAERLFSVFGWPVTNSLLASWGTAIFLLLGSYILSKRIKLIPSFAQNALEIFTERSLDTMEGLFGSRSKAERYFPLIATIFFFILFSNWLGIFPGVGSLWLEEDGMKIPLLRSAASDLNFTLALAIVAVAFVHFFGVRSLGVQKHVGRFFSFRNPLNFFVGILEFISEFAKMISFSFRLFGNIFAGEVLLIITAFLVPFVIPVPFLMLELFVGFIQALVFAMLTMVFISVMVASH